MTNNLTGTVTQEKVIQMNPTNMVELEIPTMSSEEFNESFTNCRVYDIYRNGIPTVTQVDGPDLRKFFSDSDE